MRSVWTSLISIFGPLIAIIALIVQVRRARIQQSIDLLFRLEDNFFGEEKCEQRSLAASGILRGDFSEAEDILDFFETVALLVRKKSLDRYMVWHTFSYWIYGYFEAARDHIKAEQLSDPLRWKDLCEQVPKMQALHKKELLGVGEKEGAMALGKIIPDAAAVQAFLKEELLEGRNPIFPSPPASPRTPQG